MHAGLADEMKQKPEVQASERPKRRPILKSEPVGRKPRSRSMSDEAGGN